MHKNLFIFGYGFSSKAIAREARVQFNSIYGTTRNPDKAERLSSQGVSGLVFDGINTSNEVQLALRESTHMLISIAPGEADPVLETIGNKLSHFCPNLQWIGYLSTVGVYGNHDGAWIDEETEPKPVSKRSKQRVAAENEWKRITEKMDIPLAVFRLSGIYGPGRNTFTTIEAGRSRRLVKPGQVFNRIHSDDIGSAVASAIKNNIPGIFNITDNEPAPPQDLITLAHELMGKTPPPEMDFETADITPMARSFYGENKRVRNQKSKDILGMEYKWPDYRTALTRMWEAGSWK